MPKKSGNCLRKRINSILMCFFMLSNWHNTHMVNYYQSLLRIFLFRNHTKFIIIQTFNSKIGNKFMLWQERVIFKSRKLKRHAITSMFLTRTRNNPKLREKVTNVIFVKVILNIKMAITTADKGVITMFALIVLSSILFLLDM
jgi:hypothetical protein